MSNFRTKYLKIACNLLWAVFLLIFAFAFLPKLLIYFMPFVVGMIFAMPAEWQLLPAPVLSFHFRAHPAA